MLRAALSVAGRVVVGDSHLSCFRELAESERDRDVDSGLFDADSGEFISEREHQTFSEKEIYLVRHGHYCPDWQDCDPDIDEEGIAQARRTAAVLAERSLLLFTGITSPLLRCLRTAAVLQEDLGINFRIVPGVMETPNFIDGGGIFKLKNRSQSFPQFDWPTAKEWHVLPEDYHGFHERVKETLQQMPPRSIVVTHEGFICLTAKIAFQKELLKDRGFPPGSVTYMHKHDAQRLGWSYEEVLQDRPEAEYRKTG